MADDDQQADRPEVDALRERHRQARGALGEVIVVTEAENTVASVRQTELVATQQAAWRRWVAAKGLLTKARKDGGAGRIAAARRRVDAAAAEFDRVDDAVVAEMQQHNRARLDRLGQVLDRMSPAWETGWAVTDALARPRPAPQPAAARPWRGRAVTAPVVALHGAAGTTAAAERALAAIERYLGRCKLAPNTVAAYRRQCAAYVGWLAAHAADHPDAFADVVGAEAAVTRWRRHLLQRKASPASVNQALAAVTLLYEHGPQLRIAVKRARVERPGEPDALTPAQQGALERAADRRGRRDAAIVAALLYMGARVEECARLEVDDVAITPRTGQVRLLGKGDQVRVVPLPARGRERVSAWLLARGNRPGPLWLGQRGPLSISGVTQVVLAVGRQAGMQGLRPHRLRHTYATRLRQGGADPAQVQALLGLASVETAGRYFRAGADEQADVVERVFE